MPDLTTSERQVADHSAVNGGRLKLGSLLKRSYAIFLGNLSAFFFIMLGATSPLYGLYIWLGYDLGLGASADPTDTLVHSFLAGLLAGTLASMLIAIATGFIVYGTMRELQGRPASFGDILNHGIATLFPVLLVALLCTVIIWLGFALVVIPGLVLSVLFWVAIPVVVVERRGVMDSLRRSIDLTKGYRWPIFGLVLLYVAASTGFAYAGGSFLDYETSYLRSLFIEWGGTVVLDAFFAVASAVIYFDLKRIKEGAHVEEIAAVFN